MIYRFKLVSEEVNNFTRVIEADPDATFSELCDCICDCTGYKKEDEIVFYICDDDWQQETAVTFDDRGSESDQDAYLMDETPLSDLLEEEGQKLIFMFDEQQERCFYMELREIRTGHSPEEPCCLEKSGKAPIQHIALQEPEPEVKPKVATPETIQEIDDEFYGDSQYNEDELPEGFADEFEM